MIDLVRFHGWVQMYMGIFCNPIIIIWLILCHFLPLFLSLFCLFSSVPAYFVGFCPFHSWLTVSIFLSLDFSPSLLVYVTPQIFPPLLTNSGVWLPGCLSVSLPLSIGFFLYASLNLFLWVSIPLFHCVFTHLTLFLWTSNSFSIFGFSSVLSLLIIFLGISSLSLYDPPRFLKTLKKKCLQLLSWLLTSVLYILFHVYMFYIFVGAIFYKCIKYSIA